MCAVFRLHFKYVLAVEPRLAFCDFVERIAREHCAECGFSRTVGSHDGVYFAVVDGEVDASQYFLASDCGVEVLYF